MNNENIIGKRQVIRYIALPGFVPRFRELFGQGFMYVPYFIALVYGCVRLLPQSHPYLNPANIGRFGIRHVIAEAANHLVLSRKNIDQILLFILILIGMAIIAVQLFLLSMGLFMQSAHAFGIPHANFNHFFITGGGLHGGTPAQDISFILLDMVFGVPEMFLSCVDPASGANCLDSAGNPILISADHPTLGGLPYEEFAAWPWPIHEGLHQLFAIYSYGMLIVAVIITVYFMITVVAETAQSGTAFGQRFNKVWAPIRIVVAFGLLVPIVYGLNSGQYIVLYAAKWGSGFATNGWLYFNDSITNHYHDGVVNLAAAPNFPETTTLLQFFYTVATCAYIYEAVDNINIAAYAVREPLAPTNHLRVFGISGADDPVNAALPYNTMMGWKGDDANRVIVRFGIRDPVQYTQYKGFVKPLCGEVSLDLTDPRAPGVANPGVETLQRFYWWLIKKLFINEGHLSPDNIPADLARQHHRHIAHTIVPDLQDEGTDPPFAATAAWRDEQIERGKELFNEVLNINGGPDDLGDSAIQLLEDSPEWGISPRLLEKGWGGAAIWYNRIADMNGALTSAVFSIPMPTKYPYVMEIVAERKRQYDQNVATDERFNPDMPDGQTVPFPDPGGDPDKAQAMWKAFSFWNDADNATSVYTAPTGNIFNDAIMAIFGTEGLFEMRNNTDVHPLAQLTAIGRSLIESTIRNIGYIAVGGVSGHLLTALGMASGGAAAGAISSFLVSITMIGLTIGFILFYVVPFLPFIYFFFAVGGWVKGIFEAMVGIPLWALAHIRIDGEGLPGNAAINGYFLIFEIFIRPILIIFGFLAGILIFAAMVEALNNIFDLVTGNLTGFSMTAEKKAAVKQIEYYRSAIDQFMFTVIYAIIVYLMAQSSFKLIDLIPNSILRWMGQSVSTFNDERQDPAEGLVSRSQMGAQQAIGSIGGGLGRLVTPNG